MISLNEIRRRATAFSHEFATETDEKGEASPFWEHFFDVFGVSRRRVASFEHRVKKADGAQGFIDVFWPGVLLAEHKTKGRDLDKAYGYKPDQTNSEPRRLKFLLDAYEKIILNTPTAHVKIQEL